MSRSHTEMVCQDLDQIRRRKFFFLNKEIAVLALARRLVQRLLFDNKVLGPLANLATNPGQVVRQVRGRIGHNSSRVAASMTCSST